MNIIFDLDGTLIDSKSRLFELFQHLAPTSRLSYAQYWDFKKNKISNEKILTEELGFDHEAVARFVKEWMGLIESPEFLALDVNFPDIHATLTRLGKHATLHVCTARQHRTRALEQLQSLGLLGFFQQIMVTEQRHPKEFLIRQQVRELSNKDWILGDTGKDIQVGKSLGIHTCAVLSGFQNRFTLRDYGPDQIRDSAADFSLPNTGES